MKSGSSRVVALRALENQMRELKCDESMELSSESILVMDDLHLNSDSRRGSLLKTGDVIQFLGDDSGEIAIRRAKKCVKWDTSGSNSRGGSGRSSLNSTMNSSASSTNSKPDTGVVVKPILKSKIAPEQVAKLLQKEKKRTDAIEKVQQRSGSIMYKFNASGDRHKRYFYVSDDGTELQWKKHRIGSKVSSIELASVRQLIIGPRTERFSKYDWISGRPWLCMSLVTDSRTVDIECKDVEEFDIWFQGLAALVPTSKDTLYTRGRILWQRALIKSIQISVKSKMNSLELVWQELVNSAYRRKSSGLEKFLVS
eukprot:TRINITY_DN953_c0_g2_i1.p1 TRINITY_DN953_c0_g2~~TRINITY_DN953_c0_g2_i1.p1  ORF type:complete len:312 (+),score=66.98 TRINITY_DN953_c0_g2_i1:68-1003(+)